jgi:hypothetical protein
MALDFTVQDTKHTVVAKFRQNHLPDAKKPYTLRAVFQPELDVHGLASKGDIHNIETGPKVIEEGMNAGFALAFYHLADGYRFKTPLFTMYLRFPGEYEGSETGLADGAVPEIRIQPSARLRRSIGENVKIVIDGIDQADGLIAEAVDEKTGLVDDVVTIGNLLTIHGYGLKIEGDEAHQAQMGVFFVPPSGLPLKTELIAVNEPKTLKIVVPSTLTAGTQYTLRIFTMSSAKTHGTLLKEVRDIKSDFKLTAQS